MLEAEMPLSRARDSTEMRSALRADWNCCRQESVMVVVGDW
jgi:hypothetical protein